MDTSSPKLLHSAINCQKTQPASGYQPKLAFQYLVLARPLDRNPYPWHHCSNDGLGVVLLHTDPDHLHNRTETIPGRSRQHHTDGTDRSTTRGVKESKHDIRHESKYITQFGSSYSHIPFHLHRSQSRGDSTAPTYLDR
jgi:hypothetical protein